MPKFEAMPQPKPKVEEEEEERGFKVVDKRVGPEALRQAEKELEKKRFDAMTPEQREEWEFNRDKERGFTVRDRRSAINIEDYRPEKVESKPAQVLQVPEIPKVPPAEEQKEPLVEAPAPMLEPKPESAADSLRRQAREIRQETVDLRSSVGNVRNEIARAEKEFRLKFGGPAGKKMITLESSALKQRLTRLYTELENKLSNLAKLETNIYSQENISKEINGIKQKLFDLKSEAQPSQKAKHPLRFLKKLFGR